MKSHIPKILLSLLSLCLLLPSQSAYSKRQRTSQVYLDGKLLHVYWSDGDTFRTLGSRRYALKARLAGYNTLENYGPVHKWGKWKPWELHGINNRATNVARSKTWKCTRLPGSGGYGRALVACPGLARTFIRQGLAHVYSVKGSGNAALLKIQKQAQKRKKGIWRKGVPPFLITSLHSARFRKSYNRMISTKDGSSTKHWHSKRYSMCSWICIKGSCMLFVPYKKRYGNRRPSCLRKSFASSQPVK